MARRPAGGYPDAAIRIRVRLGRFSAFFGALVHQLETLVFYMGLKRFDELRQRLLEHGVPGARPVAVIHTGTRSDQAIHRGRLDTAVAAAPGDNPALIMVGGCVDALPVADALLAAPPTKVGVG